MGWPWPGASSLPGVHPTPTPVRSAHRRERGRRRSRRYRGAGAAPPQHPGGQDSGAAVVPALNVTALWGLLKGTFTQWNEDKPFQLAAALSYYTLFSLAPLLIIAIAVAGLVFGQEAAQHQIVGAIQGIVGRQSAEAIQEMIKNAGARGSGITATLLGVGTLLIGAGGGRPAPGFPQHHLGGGPQARAGDSGAAAGALLSRWRWCSGSASCSWSRWW